MKVETFLHIIIAFLDVLFDIFLSFYFINWSTNSTSCKSESAMNRYMVGCCRSSARPAVDSCVTVFQTEAATTSRIASV